MKELARRLALRRVPGVRVLPLEFPAAALGWFGPTLLVVARELEETLGAEELRGMLAHEMAHLKRRDERWAFLESLVLALSWFNPVLRLVGTRMENEVEKLCDGAASGGSGPLRPVRYAELLLKVAQQFVVRTPTQGFLGGSARLERGFLMERVSHLCEPESNHLLSQRVEASLLLLAALLVAAGSFGYSWASERWVAQLERKESWYWSSFRKVTPRSLTSGHLYESSRLGPIRLATRRSHVLVDLQLRGTFFSESSGGTFFNNSIVGSGTNELVFRFEAKPRDRIRRVRLRAVTRRVLPKLIYDPSNPDNYSHPLDHAAELERLTIAAPGERVSIEEFHQHATVSQKLVDGNRLEMDFVQHRTSHKQASPFHIEITGAGIGEVRVRYEVAQDYYEISARPFEVLVETDFDRFRVPVAELEEWGRKANDQDRRAEEAGPPPDPVVQPEVGPFPEA